MSSRHGNGYPGRERPPPQDYRDLDGDRADRSYSRAPLPRRSVSPPGRSGGGGRSYGRHREDEREDRHDRDDRYSRRQPYDPRDEYRRDGPPLPREDRDRDRYAAPAPRRGDRGFDGKRRQHSPPQRNRRERDEDEEREALQTQKEAEQQQADDAADGDEEQEMMKAMGFGGFGTTKGSKVQGNQTGFAEVRKERSWRQYMQRKGGFNRPLSPVRD